MISKELKEKIEEFITSPVLININREDTEEIINLGDNFELEEFEDIENFNKYLDSSYDGLIVLIECHDNFELEKVDEINKVLYRKFCFRYIIGAKVVSQRGSTKYNVITIKNQSAKVNYLAQTKKLIEHLEDPLVEIEIILLELDRFRISQEEKEKILSRLKFLGEIFEPKKGKLKSL